MIPTLKGYISRYGFDAEEDRDDEQEAQTRGGRSQPAAGWGAISFPRGAALERAYAHLKRHGDSTGLPPEESYGFGRICELMGFPEVWDFEKRWAVAEGGR